MIHRYIVGLEIFFEATLKGMKVFGNKTKVMALNQAEYNGFLAAGLSDSVSLENTAFTVFFLVSVFVAGFYRANATKKLKIYTYKKFLQP